MKIIKIVVALSLLTSSLFAQQTSLTGTIRDAESGEVIDYASVMLTQQPGNQYVAGVQSDESGQFSFNNLKPGTYSVRITFIGYHDYSQGDIQVETGQSLNLSIDIQKAESEVLEEVVIEGERPSMRLGIDRKIFDVSQSMVSAGGSATDLLANVPSLSVDMDGSVSLRGSSSVRILVDGKPSAMAGSDITQFLQSLPANSIETIEVITNPSSKYDAEGQSGIINIVLKKNLKTGLNGMVNLSAGSYESYNAGVNLNYRNEKFNYFGNYNFRTGNRTGGGFNNNLNYLNNGITRSTTDGFGGRSGHNAKIGADYYFNEKTTLGISGDFSFRKSNRGEEIFYEYIDLPDYTGTSVRTSDQDEDDFGYDINLNFRRDFNRPGEMLLANISYGKEDEDGIEEFYQEFTDPEQFDARSLEDTYEEGDNLNIQIDYTLPFSEDSKLEAGYRTTIRNSWEEQISDTLNIETNQFDRDYNYSNQFDLKDIVHAVYTNYQNKITESLGFQVGIRAEQAYLNTEYRALDPESGPPTPGKLDYFRIYPSAFLTQQLANEQQLQVSYTRRVRRPRGWQVNPFEDRSDNMNLRRGNPNLRPEDIHSFEVGYAKFWPIATLTSSIYHRRVNDVIESIRTRVDEQTSATISQWYNLSRNESTGFELISKVNPNRILELTGNFNLFYSKFHGSEEYGLGAREGLNWNANLTSEVQVTNKLTGQLRADYRAPRIQPQGRSLANFVMDAGLKMDVLNDQGSIMLNVRDLFNQRRWAGYTETDLFRQDYERRWRKRTFTLSLSYRFGRQDSKSRNTRDQGDFDRGSGETEEMGPF